MRLDHLLAASIPGVTVPDPKAPSGDDIIDKGKEGGNALANLDGSWLTIIVCVVLAFLVMRWMKNPLVKGAIIGVVLLAIVLAVYKN